MTRTALQQRIQLLLSWREQTGKLLRKAPPGISGKRGHLRANARQAEFYLRKTIASHHGLIEKLGLELQAALGEIGRIESRAAAGRIRQEDASLARREMELRIERLREEITAYNTLLRAKRSSEAGGFIELPLAEYASRLGILPVTRKPSRWELRDYMTVAIVAIVASTGGYAYYLHASAVKLSCSGSYRTASPEGLVLSLTNIGITPVRLHAPWPNPIPPGMQAMDCGLSVYARLDDHKDYQFVPTSPGEWEHAGTALDAAESLSIPCGLNETVTLDLRPLRGRLKSLSAVKVDTTDSRGGLLCSQEWKALPEAPLP